MPYHMVKPSALDLIKHGRKDFADVQRYSADPKAFLAFLDTLGVERAGLINYVAPKIIGFTPEVNDWSAKYCSAAFSALKCFFRPAVLSLRQLISYRGIPELFGD